MQDATARLRDAVTDQGLAPGEAKRKRGRPGVTLVWLRPEPVTLRRDTAGRLVLEDFLPFVLPGGRLHRQVKAWLAQHPGAGAISRGGHLSIAMAAPLADLLAVARGLKELLERDWPDYAGGVFAKPLT